MNPATLELPTGAALEQEINAIAVSAHDEQVRQTITQRLAIANSANATFVPHDEVFKASRARLLAKLTQQKHA